MRDNLPPLRQSAFWTPERVLLLRSIKRDFPNLSFQAIASMPQFKGATRDAIAGKCFRMGLCKKDPHRRHYDRRRA